MEAVSQFMANEIRYKIPDPASWRDLLDLEKVRDCIAHTSGCVEESRDKVFLRALARRKIGFEIWEDGYVRIHPEFCQRMLTSVENFFVAAFDNTGFGRERPSL